MRVSCDISDPGYAAFQGYGKHQVLLNGVEIHEVITADDDAGEVIRLARDEFGALILNDARNDFVRELVRGKVEIATVQTENCEYCLSRPQRIGFEPYCSESCAIVGPSARGCA